MRTRVFSYQGSSVVPHARGVLALAMGFRPVAKDRLSMTHCKPFKKIKPNFFLGLALKTCIEGNCIEKARFIAIKPVKSRVYGGCKNFHQFNQDKCLVRGMTLISRGHRFFKWTPLNPSNINASHCYSPTETLCNSQASNEKALLTPVIPRGARLCTKAKQYFYGTKVSFLKIWKFFWETWNIIVG